MGYYSEVGIALKKADYEALKRKIDSLPDWKADLKDYVNHLLADAECTDPYAAAKEYAGTVVAIHWKSVKWYLYDDMPEVDFLMDFIRHLPNYSFTRVGEDAGDIEEEHKGDCNLDIFSIQSKIAVSAW